MFKRLFILFAISIFLMASNTWALNSLHHAQYSFYPQPFSKDRSQVQVGGRSKLEGDAALPVALIYGLGTHAEFGFKYEIDSRQQDFNKDNLAHTLDFGLRFKITDIETIQMDIILGLGSNQGNGVIVGYDIFHGLTRAFQVIYQSKVSFFEGLNGSDEIAIVELGLYPRIRFGESFHVIGGLSYSNSITSPIDYQSFDISPGFELRLAGGSKLQFLVDMGVAGKLQQEPFLYNLGYSYDF